MRGSRFALVTMAAFAFARVAAAQTTDAPPAPPPTAAPASADDAAWQERYDHARDRLIHGDFAEAATELESLAAGTHDPSRRALVDAQAGLAREWERRGLVLVQRSDLGESTLSAKAAGERTTDEISILYLNAVVYGIGTGGWVATLTKPQGAAGVVLPMLLFAGGAAGGVALLDSGHPLRYGVPQSIVSGMYVGFEEGLVLTLWNSAGDTHWSGETQATVIWGLSTAGAVAGGAIGASVGTTPGRASLVGSSALWGGIITGLAAGAIGSNDDGSRGALLAADVGLNAGAIAGMIAAGPVSPSIARVRFLDLGAIGGGLVAGGLYLAAADKNADGRAAAGITAVGIVGGLAIAWAATSGMPADRLDVEEREAKPVATWSPTLFPTQKGMAAGVQGMF